MPKVWRTIVGTINLGERVFSLFREQKKEAARFLDFMCWQNVYAMVDLPVPAMPLSQNIGELSLEVSSAQFSSFPKMILRVSGVHARLVGPSLTASASKSAFGAKLVNLGA